MGRSGDQVVIDYDQFIADLPEFANATTYPESGFTYWSNMAGLLLNGARLGLSACTGEWIDDTPLQLYDIATEMFVAHNLVLEKMAQDAANRGNPPGDKVGPTASKSVGSVSVSYNTEAGIEPNAGHWNLTTFGTRLMKLYRLAGAGPIHVGGGYGCGVAGWPGVIQPFWG